MKTVGRIWHIYLIKYHKQSWKAQYNSESTNIYFDIIIAYIILFNVYIKLVK